MWMVGTFESQQQSLRCCRICASNPADVPAPEQHPGRLHGATAAAYSALTASMKIRTLDLSCCALPEDVWTAAECHVGAQR